jgi:hypothetical protein
VTGRRLAVFHLVREANGPGPLARFLESYQDHPANLEHDLVFILKGFRGNRVDRGLAEQIDSVRHHRLYVTDWGYDITAYFVAAKLFECDLMCFLNSFCEILVPGWLEGLYRAMCLPDAGASSATGSYQGFNPERCSLPDAENFAARPTWKRKLLEISFIEKINVLRRKLQFPPFPNPHLRTNALMIRRRDFLALRPHHTFTKRQAYSFESGRSGLTSQLLGAGKHPYVVGRDGHAYGLSDWMHSHTFWIGKQENLMVADNQTRRYQNATDRERRVLTWDAWGPEDVRECAGLVDE